MPAGALPHQISTKVKFYYKAVNGKDKNEAGSANAVPALNNQFKNWEEAKS